MATVITITKDTPQEEIEEKLKEIESNRKKPNLRQYVGVIKLKEDPLEIQKKMRSEWD